jgi:hypothetical protein
MQETTCTGRCATWLLLARPSTPSRNRYHPVRRAVKARGACDIQNAAEGMSARTALTGPRGTQGSSRKQNCLARTRAGTASSTALSPSPSWRQQLVDQLFDRLLRNPRKRSPKSTPDLKPLQIPRKRFPKAATNAWPQAIGGGAPAQNQRGRRSRRWALDFGALAFPPRTSRPATFPRGLPPLDAEGWAAARRTA